MHGRVKIKTTAEQAEEKRKEREKKLQVYQQCSKRIFEKRALGEHDEESLQLTGKLLCANPDVYTFWNYRKEVLLEWNKQRSTDDLVNIYQGELSLTEQCLQVNPKSYGAWHHRCFAMTNHPTPNWSKELALCNQFLQMDERNFHCWDHRRFVVKSHCVSAQSEFAYTTELISSNFSNYSSWHYRSQLLPVVYPDKMHPSGLQEDILVKEFELAQNAFFTDPTDQSAWLYHLWLLGRGDSPLMLHSAAVTTRDSVQVLVVFNHYVQVSECPIVVTINDQEIPVSWQTVNDEDYAKVLEGEIDNARIPAKINNVRFALRDGCNSIDIPIQPGVDVHSHRYALKTGSWFSSELTAVTSDMLTEELKACRQLNELEPNNKWTMLTIVLLMRALDPHYYNEDIMSMLNNLQVIDPPRLKYYRDLRSRYVIENHLNRFDPASTVLDLSNQLLTSIYHAEFMATLRTVKLHENALSSCPSLASLRTVCHLSMDGSCLVDNLEVLPQWKSLESLQLSCSGDTSGLMERIKNARLPQHLKEFPVFMSSSQ